MVKQRGNLFIRSNKVAYFLLQTKSSRNVKYKDYFVDEDPAQQESDEEEELAPEEEEEEEEDDDESEEDMDREDFEQYVYIVFCKVH